MDESVISLGTDCSLAPGSCAPLEGAQAYVFSRLSSGRAGETGLKGHVFLPFKRTWVCVGAGALQPLQAEHCSAGWRM